MTVESSPLLAHASPESVVAYRAGEPIAALRFLSDAVHLAQCLPDARHVLNVCTDRYRFTVGLAACLMSGRISLLPSTHTPEVIRQMADFAPDAFCLTDDPRCDIELPRLNFPQHLPHDLVEWQVPQLPSTQLAAIVFTSGSTGTPLPYRKTWGRLSRCVRDGAPRLGLCDGRQHTLIGTVPAQHMYGFESTVLLALLSGNAFCAERPFYPADVCASIAAVPRPRALISTPIHLRTVLAAAVELPAVDLIVSATAPLDIELAHEVERRCAAQVLEIYGSTETGQIATRRTALSPLWVLWPDVTLEAQHDQVFAAGGHVEQRTPMWDVIEIKSRTEFLLHGRTADLVNVAGKRSSFGYLNTQLLAIPGVLDGAFFLREPDPKANTGVARLAAAVVAPTLDAAALLEHLRQRIDPVFLPRPLLLVKRLPRNATGKLPQAALQALLVSHDAAAPARVQGPLDIPAEHPAYPGHFPGMPLLPGAALLDAVILEVERSRRLTPAGWQIANAKFLEIVRPGTALTLEHVASTTGAIRFTIRAADITVATGVLTPGVAA